jgi:hypothetical protein
MGALVFQRVIGDGPAQMRCKECGAIMEVIISGVLWRVGVKWAHSNLLEGRMGTPRAERNPGDLGIAT